MTRVTDILSREHQTVLKKLENFENALNESNIDVIKDTIYFFENKLVLHRKKEEEILFKELEKYRYCYDGPVICMLHEHETERGLIENLKALISPNAKINIPAIRKTGSEIIHLLRLHIMKEDNVLFPMAEENLTEEEKNRVAKGFEKIGNCCEECAHHKQGEAK